VSCNRNVDLALKSLFIQTTVARRTFPLRDMSAGIADVLYGRYHGVDEPCELLEYHGLNSSSCPSSRTLRSRTILSI
jgi:hypothetical protein